MAKINFIGALQEIGRAVPVVVGIVFTLTIGVISVGVLLNAVSSGTISVGSNITAFLSNWTTQVVSIFNQFAPIILTTMGLLVVVILGYLFRDYLSGNSKKGGERM